MNCRSWTFLVKKLRSTNITTTRRINSHYQNPTQIKTKHYFLSKAKLKTNAKYNNYNNHSYYSLATEYMNHYVTYNEQSHTHDIDSWYVSNAIGQSVYTAVLTLQGQNLSSKLVTCQSASRCAHICCKNIK